MKKHVQSIGKIASIAALCLIVLVGIVAVWFYKTPYSAAKEKIAFIVPLPAVLVNGHPIWMREVALRTASAKAYYANTGGKYDEQAARRQVVDQLVSEKKLAEIAANRGVSVSDKELSDALRMVKDDSNKQNPSGFQELLKQYNITESQFRDEVLQPQLLYVDLSVWFNRQRTLNPSQYSLVDAIVAVSRQGADFSGLVQQYSQDDASKALQGDLGFLSEKDLLPEFREVVDGAKAGDVASAPSRYGIHIFKVEEKDNKGDGGMQRVHLRQIFLKPENSNQWFERESKNMRVRQLIKI